MILHRRPPLIVEHALHAAYGQRPLERAIQVIPASREPRRAAQTGHRIFDPARTQLASRWIRP